MVYSAARGGVEAPGRWHSTTSSRQLNEQFWYDVEDEATHDLREVLGHKSGRFSDWTPAHAGPGGCLSAGSTRATTPPRLGTPPPPLFSPPPSTDCSETANFEASDESPTHLHPSRNPSGYQDKELWKQYRKVFVGGVPQTMDGHSFTKIFENIGKVDRAWLQWQHDPEGRQMQKHRGFGFVIFKEIRTIDKLLGQDMSKFIWFGDTLKLEVKRAFGKNESASTPTPDYNRGRNLKQRMQGSQCSTPSSQTWQSNCSPVSSKSWTSHPWLYSNASLPGVPPFPVADSNAMDPSQSRGVSTAASPTPDALPNSDNIMTNASWICGFVGQQPRDRQELEQLLQAAAPDHYED